MKTIKKSYSLSKLLILIIISHFFLIDKGIVQVNKSVILEPVSIVGDKADELFFFEVSSIRYNKYDDRVYVVDSGNHRIVVLDKKLNFISEFGREGQGPVEFLLPMDIAFDSENSFIVGENKNPRVQIINQNYDYIGGFRLGSSVNNISIDSNDRIFLKFLSKEHLITVYDKNGTLISSFGELFDFENLNFKFLQNDVVYRLDEEDNIYCAFKNYPIIRKYDKNFNLVYESNYEYLESVKMGKKRYDKEKRKFNNPNYWSVISCLINISIDRDYIYLKIGNENGILLFDKKTGFYLDRKIILKNHEGYISASIQVFDFSAPEFIYCYYGHDMLIFKYDKPSF